LMPLACLLTTDEVSETRWTEVGYSEELLHRFNHSISWKHAPVECTRHFKKRLDRFLANFVTQKNQKTQCQNVLGSVKQYMIRYESQDRGPLHVHMLLWLDETDVERVSQEIVACVPAEWDEDPRAGLSPQTHIRRHCLT
jgi:hypothetical protein